MVNTVMNNSLNARNDDFAVVDFSASWCGPCQMLKPIFHELADEKSRDAFYSVDVDENSTLAGEFHIFSVPTVVILKNGKEVARSVGFRPKKALSEWIESAR